MGKLAIGVDIRDFDLDRVGISVAILDEAKKRQASEAYLRMTLPELNAFLRALKGAKEEIEVATVEPSGVTRFPGGRSPRPREEETAAAPIKFLAAE